MKRFKRGQRITDDQGRKGRILAQWGAFSGCPECSALTESKERTACCGKLPRTVSGAGIYDVILNNGGFYSFHFSRLTA